VRPSARLAAAPDPTDHTQTVPSQQPAAQPTAAERLVEERTMSRLFIYSDAVVAISATLLITIVLKLEPPAVGDSFWIALLGNGGVVYLASFALSFAFIMHFWRNHLNITDGLRASSSRLITINCFWLGTIAFLPFPTYWFAASTSRDHRGELSFYLLSIAAVGLVGYIQAEYLQRHPELFESPVRERRLASSDRVTFGTRRPVTPTSP